MRGLHPHLPVSGVEESHCAFTSRHYAALDTSTRCPLMSEGLTTTRMSPWPISASYPIRLIRVIFGSLSGHSEGDSPSASSYRMFRVAPRCPRTPLRTRSTKSLLAVTALVPVLGVPFNGRKHLLSCHPFYSQNPPARSRQQRSRGRCGKSTGKTTYHDRLIELIAHRLGEGGHARAVAVECLRKSDLLGLALRRQPLHQGLDLPNEHRQVRPRKAHVWRRNTVMLDIGRDVLMVRMRAL